MVRPPLLLVLVPTLMLLDLELSFNGYGTSAFGYDPRTWAAAANRTAYRRLFGKTKATHNKKSRSTSTADIYNEMLENGDLDGEKYESGQNMHDIVQDLGPGEYNIVYIKLYKVGSTTMNTIFTRYCNEQDLIIYNPLDGVLEMSELPPLELMSYNCLARHTRFRPDWIEDYIPNSHHFTLIRSPLTCKLSQFWWSERNKGSKWWITPEDLEKGHELLRKSFKTHVDRVEREAQPVIPFLSRFDDIVSDYYASAAHDAERIAEMERQREENTTKLEHAMKKKGAFERVNRPRWQLAWERVKMAYGNARVQLGKLDSSGRKKDVWGGRLGTALQYRWFGDSREEAMATLREYDFTVALMERYDEGLVSVMHHFPDWTYRHILSEGKFKDDFKKRSAIPLPELTAIVGAAEIKRLNDSLADDYWFYDEVSKIADAQVEAAGAEKVAAEVVELGRLQADLKDPTLGGCEVFRVSEEFGAFAYSMPERIKCMLAVHDSWAEHEPSLIPAATRSKLHDDAARLAKETFETTFPNWKPPPTPEEIKVRRAAKAAAKGAKAKAAISIAALKGADKRKRSSKGADAAAAEEEVVAVPPAVATEEEEEAAAPKTEL